METLPVYKVSRLNQAMKVDGNWDKPLWKNAGTIEIKNYMGKEPRFRPRAQAKMMYNDVHLYVIFRVEDRYVSCIKQEVNEAVYEDACVEFFFSPDTSLPGRYFNLETNCGGTALMHYNIIPRKEFAKLDTNDIGKIEIAHSLPSKVEPEISEQVTWTIEYKIPLNMLAKYSNVTRPRPGISWRANFYKLAEKGSNPHFITWSLVDQVKPDFHLPQYFGILMFQ